MLSTRRWPPLNCLRGFVAAARLGSFSAAADSLHITQSAVSHQIKTLETWLGQPLFIRQRRRIQLSDAGASLLETGEQCLSLLDRGFRRIEQYRKPNQLIVHTGTAFASDWLVARLADFRHRHAGIDVWLYTTDSEPDLDLTEVHCAILYGNGSWPELQAERLLGDLRVPLCAPGHPLLRNSTPAPSDLLAHTLLHGEDALTWSAWFESAGIAGTNPVEGPNFSSQALLLRAAELGQGVALGSLTLAADRLAAGTLVAPLGPALAGPGAFYLAQRRDGLRSPHLEDFRRWLRSSATRFESQLEPPP